MIFTDIQLQNYRSYKEASFDLGPGVNIVVGPNAAGKTNLLESLMVCATGKSFKAKDINLIRQGCDWTRIDAHTSTNQTRVVKIKLLNDNKSEKTFELDEKSYKKISENFKFPVVLFQPDDLQLLHAEPKQRRDYFDDLLEQYIPGFSSLRKDLRRVISQRNSLLKQQNFGQKQLFAWDIRLCGLANKVVDNRIDLVKKLNKRINNTYTRISGKSEKLSLEYVSKTPATNYSNNLMVQLKENINLDIERGFTSRGPHRDDIIALFADDPMSEKASRGENRTLMLSLKTLELELLEQETGKRPLLLLDDVFSELDGSRRKALTSFLSDYQTIITTTDADIISKNFTDKANLVAL